MKRILLLCLTVILVVSCSKQRKTQSLVQDFLKTKLDDYSRYEPVNWGTLDSLVNVLDEDPLYLTQKKRVDDQKEFLADLEMTMARVDSTYEGYSDMTYQKERMTARCNSEKERLETLVKAFRPGFVGWKIEHTYRAPNKLGALELQTDTFVIDKDFKEAEYKTVAVY